MGNSRLDLGEVVAIRAAAVRQLRAKDFFHHVVAELATVHGNQAGHEQRPFPPTPRRDHLHYERRGQDRRCAQNPRYGLAGHTILPGVAIIRVTEAAPPSRGQLSPRGAQRNTRGAACPDKTRTICRQLNDAAPDFRVRRLQTGSDERQPASRRRRDHAAAEGLPAPEVPGREPGRLVSKEELIAAVWADTFVTDDALLKRMKDLRVALDDERRQYIKTVSGEATSSRPM